jgi:hypothetical protein
LLTVCLRPRHDHRAFVVLGGLLLRRGVHRPAAGEGLGPAVPLLLLSCLPAVGL